MMYCLIYTKGGVTLESEQLRILKIVSELFVKK